MGRELKTALRLAEEALVKTRQNSEQSCRKWEKNYADMIQVITELEQSTQTKQAETKKFHEALGANEVEIQNITKCFENRLAAMQLEASELRAFKVRPPRYQF